MSSEQQSYYSYPNRAKSLRQKEKPTFNPSKQTGGNIFFAFFLYISQKCSNFAAQKQKEPFRVA